ncbi:MAG: hypothetical protein ACK57B_11860 [Betaproteobacteria bacterium]|jgi:hypothetical protein
MKKAERSPNRWFAAWRARPLPAPAPDPADCGTAFGLELSLPNSEAATTGPAAPPQGWRERWVRRRRPA